jgi:peroxiredoxin
MNMKKSASILICLTLFCAASTAQNRLPDVQLKSISDKGVSSLDVLEDGVPVILSFWATYCKPCLQELGALSDAYDDWQEEVKFKVVAVSEDDARSSAKATALAGGSDWPFMVLLDPNGDLKRAMNVSSIPSAFVIDAKGNIVYSHTGYTVGSESMLLDTIKSLQK